jgi:hypothetical protein
VSSRAELQDLREQEQRAEETEKTSATDNEAAEKRPLRNTCSGIIGSSRHSCQAVNAASSATAAPRMPSVATEVHPRSGA